MDSSLNEQFSRIYDQYIEKIYRFVYLKVNSKETAEDITSKVFLKGWETYQNQAVDIKNPSAFLYQIARNSVVDYYRQKGKAKIVSTEFFPQMAENSQSIQEKAIIDSDFEAIKIAIQSLKKDYQDIILWHYVEDMPVSEIAQILGKPEGTIRVMLHRGLKELKGIVKEA